MAGDIGVTSGKNNDDGKPVIVEVPVQVPVPAPVKEIKKEIKLDENDLLRLQFITEKQRRIQAEQQRLEIERQQAQAENARTVQALGAKYGVDLNNWAIFLDEGLAR